MGRQRLRQDYIPHAVAEDILVRLPVKSLMRFKCVSKEWKILFANSKFIKTHRIRTHSEAAAAAHPMNFFLYGNHAETLYALRIDSDFDGRDGIVKAAPVTTHHGSPFLPKDGYYPLLAHCDGLLCMLSSSRVVVWNPSTREHKEFGLPPITDNWDGLGFGYDSNADDYKVVLIGWRNVQCLRLKSGGRSWKVVRNYTDYLVTRPHQIAMGLKDCLYWIVSYRLDPFRIRPSTIIFLCFDLEKDIIREERYPFPSPAVLGVLGGSLCLSFGCERSEVWVRNENIGEKTAKGNWRELMGDIPVGRGGFPTCYAIKIISSIGDGRILISETPRVKLHLYDPKNKSIKKIAKKGHEGQDLQFSMIYYMISYVETLVSPSRI